MNNRIFTNNGFTFKRIDKKAARRAYNNNLTIIIAPVNLHPFNNYFSLTMDINKENINCDFQPFETIINAYEFYNCNNETGNYTAYYIPVETVDGIEKYNYNFLND